MVEISVKDNCLFIEVLGTHQLWALKKNLEIPLSHVTGVSIDPNQTRYPQGWRAPGTYVPGLITAGTYHNDGKHYFWDVSDPHKAINIALRDEYFAELTLEVADPQATLKLIETALASR